MKNAKLFFTLFLPLSAVACPGNQCSSYAWNQWGGCEEVTPGNVYIDSVNLEFCRRYIGRYFDWNEYGGCDEFTPKGYYVEAAELSDCQKSCKTVIRR